MKKASESFDSQWSSDITVKGVIYLKLSNISNSIITDEK